MLSLIFFATIGGCLWVYSGMTFLSKELLRTYALIMFFVPVLIYTFFKLTLKTEVVPEPSYIYLAFVPLFILSVIYIVKRKRVRGLKIVANQQRYWQEVTSDEVAQHYRHRKIFKGNRFATSVNVAQKRFHKNILVKNPSEQYKQIISPVFFKNLKRFEDELTTAQNTAQIANYPLYAAVFNKLKGVIKSSEKKVDYEAVLAQNNHCIEFFLLYLWENYTKRINISNANLMVLAQRDIEAELIGALDNIDLNGVKKAGAALYYRYMRFWGRDEAYIIKKDDKPSQNEPSDEQADENGDTLL